MSIEPQDIGKRIKSARERVQRWERGDLLAKSICVQPLRQLSAEYSDLLRGRHLSPFLPQIIVRANFFRRQYVASGHPTRLGLGG